MRERNADDKKFWKFSYVIVSNDILKLMAIHIAKSFILFVYIW